MSTPRAGVIDLWWVALSHIDSIEAGENGALLESASVLSGAERQRASRFKFAPDTRRFIAAHSALRRILARYTDIAAEQLEFVDETNGKPRLAGRRGVEFNLSHSHELALIAVCARDVGADVEWIRPLADAAAIAERYFTRAEQQELHTARGEIDRGGIERSERFLHCWTRKEAIVKARGARFDESMGAVEVGFAGPRAVGDLWLTSVGAGPGYCAAIASQGLIEAIRVFDFPKALGDPALE